WVDALGRTAWWSTASHNVRHGGPPMPPTARRGAAGRGTKGQAALPTPAAHRGGGGARFARGGCGPGAWARCPAGAAAGVRGGSGGMRACATGRGGRALEQHDQWIDRRARRRGQCRALTLLPALDDVYQRGDGLLCATQHGVDLRERGEPADEVIEAPADLPE